MVANKERLHWFNSTSSPVGARSNETKYIVSHLQTRYYELSLWVVVFSRRAKSAKRKYVIYCRICAQESPRSCCYILTTFMRCACGARVKHRTRDWEVAGSIPASTMHCVPEPATLFTLLSYGFNQEDLPRTPEMVYNRKKERKKKAIHGIPI